MRLKYDIAHLSGRELRDFLTEQLRHLHKDTLIEKMLLFHSTLFAGYEFATHSFPDCARKTEGTIRYHPNLIRIPANIELPVYETNEFNAKKPPRGLVTIPFIMVCRLEELTLQESRLAGFKDHTEAVDSMRVHYPELQKDSIVSFYHFGEYTAKPSRKTVERVLEQIKS